MQKAENTQPAGDTIAVSVTRMGNDPVTVRIPVGGTVAQALEAANVTAGGNTQYFVDGVRAEPNDTLEDLDVLALVTPKQAGK